MDVILIKSKRINQESVVYNNPDQKIIRSSYNFCAKHAKCKNFYNFDNPEASITCNDHHFVHSVLKNDVDSIINYLVYVLTNKIDLSLENVNDFQLSIKTIGFVTKHMAKEILLVDIKTNSNSELYHRNNATKKNKNWNTLTPHVHIDSVIPFHPQNTEIKKYLNAKTHTSVPYPAKLRQIKKHINDLLFARNEKKEVK